jgi:hypothetical protein
MSQTSSKKPNTKSGAPTVPRDRVLDGSPELRSDPTPAAVDRNIPEEDYTDRDKPLVAGSREARALHDRPPPTKGELDVGTAGDAARPSKGGIHGKPLPPRGQLGQ